MVGTTANPVLMAAGSRSRQARVYIARFVRKVGLPAGMCDHGTMRPVILVVFLIVWVLIGLATGLWMARRGHDPRWTLIAVALGPLFVPIAYERVERQPRSARPESPTAPVLSEPDGLRVLIGFDGSPHAEQALREARAIFGSRLGTLSLAQVVSFDTADEDCAEATDEVSGRLAAATADVTGVEVRHEVLAGPPGETLCWYAADGKADVIVVGRRGRGMSRRLLGSVSAHLVEHAQVPVLVVEPGAPELPSARPSGREAPSHP